MIIFVFILLAENQKNRCECFSTGTSNSYPCLISNRETIQYSFNKAGVKHSYTKKIEAQLIFTKLTNFGRLLALP